MQTAQQPSFDFNLPASPPLGRREVPVRAHFRKVDVSAVPSASLTAASPRTLPDTLPYAPGSATSKAAAEKAKGKANADCARILSLLQRHHPGLTDEEMQAALVMNANTQRPRRGDLVTGRWNKAQAVVIAPGQVRDSGRKRQTMSGSPATVWEAVS